MTLVLITVLGQDTLKSEVRNGFSIVILVIGGSDRSRYAPSSTLNEIETLARAIWL